MPFAGERLAEIEVILPAARAIGLGAHGDVGDVAAKVVDVGIEAAAKDGVRPTVAAEGLVAHFGTTPPVIAAMKRESAFEAHCSEQMCFTSGSSASVASQRSRKKPGWPVAKSHQWFVSPFSRSQ